MAEFSYAQDVPVRFQDLDAVGHVNNAVYATYLEEVRISYTEEVLEVQTDESGLVIAHLELDYRRPITEDDQVTVALRTGELGTSSIPMEYEIRAGDDVVATAETVMVTIDYDTGETRPMPEEWRERIRAYERR
jgi:acyl-CoA thioester hydrolase